MTIMTAVLITLPLAFMAGWLLAKAVFGYLAGDAREADFRKMAAAQVERLDERDAQIAELHARLDEAEARAEQTKARFRSWRERIRPIAQQFRQQRAVIAELREQLRQRSNTGPTGPASAPEPARRESISRLETES